MIDCTYIAFYQLDHRIQQLIYYHTHNYIVGIIDSWHMNNSMMGTMHAFCVSDHYLTFSYNFMRIISVNISL